MQMYSEFQLEYVYIVFRDHGDIGCDTLSVPVKFFRGDVIVKSCISKMAEANLRNMQIKQISHTKIF